MIELQQHVVLMRPATAAFLDFLIHRAADDVARREVLQVRRIALHEALAVRIQQDATLAAHRFGDQDASARDAGRVELPHFHVFKRQPRARHHAEAVARIDERIRRCGEDAPGAARRQNRRLGLQNHHLAGFHFQRSHPQHVAVGVADQIERHPLDQELGARPDVALIERVQHRMAGAIG